jgi:hypothetical protein
MVSSRFHGINKAQLIQRQRQGYDHTFDNILMTVVGKWHNAVKILVTTLLFADDLVISDHLEIGTFEVLKIAGEYNMEISIAETKGPGITR